MNTAEYKINIKVANEKFWRILFKDFGNIHHHNSNMIASNYMYDASKADINTCRSLQFNEKLYLEEKSQRQRLEKV